MKTLVRLFLWKLLSRPIVRSINWTLAERNEFELFCRSSCGIKLLEFLRQVVATQTFQAVYQDKVSANARARGMQDVLALLHRLRVFPPEESTNLEMEEQTELQGQSANESDRWRWLGGSGAIG